MTEHSLVKGEIGCKIERGWVFIQKMDLSRTRLPVVQSSQEHLHTSSLVGEEIVPLFLSCLLYLV